MKSIFYIHFNEEELNERIQPLIEAGFKVNCHWSTAEPAKFGDKLPDIFILSLNRLPSHSRQYANWIWEAKKRQHIPIIFVDGKPDKVEATRQKFPKANYCTINGLAVEIDKLTAKSLSTISSRSHIHYLLQ